MEGTMKKDDTTVKECTECHNGKDAPALKKALHKNCKDYHKDMKKKKEKTGPTKCSGCHKK